MILKTTKSLSAVVFILLVNNAICEISEESVEKINNGLELGETMLESISELGESGLFKSLGNMASFLGPVGGLISFALLFAPKTDSEELQYMKKKFAEVNSKLDTITSDLANIKDLIRYETQREQYAESASKIKDGHKRLLAFLDELQHASCTDKKSCRRTRIQIAEHYVNDFNVREHMLRIIYGATKGAAPFGEPLLAIVRRTFKCDVGKIDDLANGILRLSFKAQQIVLAYEKLKGSNYSITQSMSVWLKAVYDLREATYEIKKPCFAHISNYMIADIKDKKYQDASSNEEANKKVKTFMEKKYRWLGWVAYSFDNTDGSKYCVSTLPVSHFWNLPGDKNLRKRSLVVSFLDKSGTYSEPKSKVRDALDQISATRNFTTCSSATCAACTIRDGFQKLLKSKGVWKYIRSFAVLRKSDGLVVTGGDKSASYISSIYTIEFESNYKRHKIKLSVHLVVILKSKEMTIGKSCDKTCKNGGSCEKLPYSSANYCHCKPYFQGASCEEHSQAQLAKTIDSMLQATLKLPKLSDIAFEIEDLREYLGISIGQVQSTFKKIEATFTKAFVDLNHKLSTQFKWSNLITIYKEAIEKIQYYSDLFQHLKERFPLTYHMREKQIANAVLETDAMQKWVSDVNYLLLGRIKSTILNHQPLMIVFMEKHKTSACTPEYKVAVDNIWRQLVLLQQMGYVVWAQALQIKGWPTKNIAKLYDKRTSKQVTAHDQMTCEYSIANSANVQCTGGRYLYPAMNIANHCRANYYATGRKETTCVQKGSGCSPCNCNAANSHDNNCSDLSGQCRCKPGFKGTKCDDRDCVWGDWSKYSDTPCSKSCDYGGWKTITRSHQVTKQGNGKPCVGLNSQSKTCFLGCCPNQFLCKSNPEKCIPKSERCNYDNNCGDNKDETSCNEHCGDYRYTDWAEHSDGNMVYLDRLAVDCGGSDKVLKMFHLERDGGYVRYQFKCCTLNKPICTNRGEENEFTPDGGGDTVFLDRQTVSCASHGTGFLSGFLLRRNGAHNHIRYEYPCCYLKKERHRSRMSCDKDLTTGYSYHDDDGRSVYLDRQTVECKRHRYFLSSFVLERDHGGGNHWRYRYTCCRVKS